MSVERCHLKRRKVALGTMKRAASSSEDEKKKGPIDNFVWRGPGLAHGT